MDSSIFDMHKVIPIKSEVGSDLLNLKLGAPCEDERPVQKFNDESDYVPLRKRQPAHPNKGSPTYKDLAHKKELHPFANFNF